jgi:hypothetical protein
MTRKPVDVPRVKVSVFSGYDSQLSGSSRLAGVQMIQKEKLLETVLTIPHLVPNLAVVPHHATRVA